MLHGAILSEVELALLRQITDVVRLGRVRPIDPERMVLDDGEVKTLPGMRCMSTVLPPVWHTRRCAQSSKLAR